VAADPIEEAEDDPHFVVETDVIPEVTSVRIYQSSLQHVIVHRPEIGRNVHLPSIVGAVTKGLTGPTTVEPSYNQSFVFVDEDSTDVRGQPLRIAVRVVSGTSCRMKSFYFAEPENPKPTIYRRSDNDKP
jgi:hypothetical protein